MTRLFEPARQRSYAREIEKKFTLNVPFQEALVTLEKLFPNPDKILEGTSSDTFWKAKGVDFVRLRKNTSELTLKITDMDTIEDRIEENLVVDYETAYRMCEILFGKRAGELQKTYNVFYINNEVVVSLYKVLGHPQVFLEVEADDIYTVRQYSNQLRQTFDMKQEYRSLFQIIFGDR